MKRLFVVGLVLIAIACLGQATVKPVAIPPRYEKKMEKHMTSIKESVKTTADNQKAIIKILKEKKDKPVKEKAA